MVDQVFQDRTSEKAQMLILLINAGFIQVSYHIFFSYMYICLGNFTYYVYEKDTWAFNALYSTSQTHFSH